jgi:hypothetical protein
MVVATPGFLPVVTACAGWFSLQFVNKFILTCGFICEKKLPTFGLGTLKEHGVRNG